MQLNNKGLSITHLLWHQGETDARLGTSPKDYKRFFSEILESLRKQGVTADIFVSIATRCYENNGADALREAQKQLVNPSLGILAGPDTDTLGPEHRYDDCHFSERGLQAAATLWFEALTAGRHQQTK